MPVVEKTAPSGVRFIDCGRTPGPLHDPLATLHRIAAHAAHHGRTVGWS